MNCEQEQNEWPLTRWALLSFVDLFPSCCRVVAELLPSCCRAVALLSGQCVASLSAPETRSCSRGAQQHFCLLAKGSPCFLSVPVFFALDCSSPSALCRHASAVSSLFQKILWFSFVFSDQVEFAVARRKKWVLSTQRNIGRIQFGFLSTDK